MLAQHHYSPADECPCSSIFLGMLYRASPQGLEELIATVPPATRAMLALYCYRRSHLQSIGLAIAASCDEHDLESFGGTAGSALFERASQPSKILPSPSVYSQRKNVTLSGGVLKKFCVDDDDVASAVHAP